MPETKEPDPAGKPQDRRKLVAVVYADMVGYSRLIGLDDAGTLQRLRTLRREVIDHAIDEHNGRIVQTGGDSFLIVFDSIDGAVRCAVKVQQQVPIYDGDRPPDEAIRFRVGINLGDAIADGTDLHGEAVNVAARLQAECPPGGICVTRPVRDHVRDRLDLAFEELGVLSLKNIARPVEAFLVKLNATGATQKSVERSLVRGEHEVLPLPDKPSIAVLAFTNMSGDPEQEYFSDGIADDIITELSRSHSLFVIARNSSFTYRGRSVDVKQIAREVGVRYVVTGSVRKVTERVRINAQLTDAIAGNQIWAERYDRELFDVFSVQDEITVAIVGAILPTVTDAELRRILRKPLESLGAWEAYQRGLWHLGKASATDNEEAKAFFQHAVTLDAAFAPAYTSMSIAYSSWTVYAGQSPEAAARLATEWARKAVEIDSSDADAHALLALTTGFAHGRYDQGLERMSLALSINPNSPLAHTVQGGMLAYCGRPSEGRDALLTAIRLSPRDPNGAIRLGHLCMTYYFERDYVKATEVASSTVLTYPGFPSAYRWLAASLGQLARVDEARDALQRALEVSRPAFDAFVRSKPAWFRSDDYDHVLDGLRKAGWQG